MLLFHGQYISVKQLFHLINSGFSFFKISDKFIAIINLSVLIGVLIYLKGCTRKLVIRIFSVHLRESDIAVNILIDNLNFNYLLGFADIDLIRFFIKNKSLWLLDFSYNPFAIRNFCKEKLPSFAEVVVISAVSFVNSVSSALKIPITAPSSASPFSSIFLPDTEP